MGSVAHVEDERKELVKDVHRIACLGVCLIELSDMGVITQKILEFSFVVEVKDNQYSDLLLI